MIKKLIYIVLIISLCLVIFTGCVDVNLGYYLNYDGSVVRSYSIKMDTKYKDYENIYYSVDNVLEKMYNDNKSYANLTKDKEKGIISLVYTYPSFCVDVNLGYYLNYDGSVVRSYIIKMDTKYKDYEKIYYFVDNVLEKMYNDNKSYANLTKDKEKGIISLVYTYPSLTECYIALGRTGNEKDNAVDRSDIKKTFFYNYQTVYMFSDVEKKVKLYSKIGKVDIDKVTINFEYGTKYNKFVKSDADSIKVVNNTNIFTWNMKANDLKDRTIVFKTPNTQNWYLTAIVSSLLIVFIIFLITKKVKSNGTKKTISE